MSLGTLRIESTDTNLRFQMHALSLSASNIALVSVAGQSAAIKSLRAFLQSPEQKVRFSFSFPEGEYIRTPRDLAVSPQGYQCFTHRLWGNTYHLLALSRQDGILPVYTPDALWRELTSDRYTTPLLRSWLPYIQEKMEALRLLRKLSCFRCNVAGLQCSSDELDVIISTGLKTGALAIDP